MDKTNLPPLLPCPMCGGEAASNRTTTTDAEFIRLNNRDTGYGVNCIVCGLNNRGIAIGYASTELAAAAWNARAVREAVPGWQPIETVPLGDFLVAVGGWVTAAYRNPGESIKSMSLHEPFVEQPTHWQPFAAAPTQDQENGS